MLRRALVCGCFTLILLVIVPSNSKQIATPRADASYPVRVITNVAYGPNYDEDLDFCLPEGTTALRPGIILIHSGGWSGGDKTEQRYTCSVYAAQGYVAAAINYRLASRFQWPDQIGDTQLAVRFLRANASRLSLDPTRICAYGDSAGAHLALLLDTMISIYPSDVSSITPTISPQVNCVVDQFGPTDLTKMYNEDPIQRETLYNLLDYSTPQTNPQIYIDASPVTHVSSQSGQIWIEQGDVDNLVKPDQSAELQQEFQNAQVPYVFGSYHGNHEYKGVSTQLVNEIHMQMRGFVDSIEK